jgi:hypothetical protein
VHLAEERQKVVFAQIKHLNVLDDYHLVSSYIEHRTQQNLLRVLLIAWLSTAWIVPCVRGVLKAVTLWVLAETDQHFPYQVL